MKDNGKCRSGCVWAAIVFAVWLVINVRVEAGLGTSFERAVDGIVGGAVLLTSIFLAWKFYDSIGQENRE